ncbi:PTS sugar transporter subunit IIA [Companilactobacillus sp. HBUAS56275]|uniref:PTS sugar transporter subunit IIA n=1 Tax=Candidatus Companilactobacillus pullicola TaxID=2838523 RepID=A0A9D1ZM01_9LACO|nr:PTS sugar transporter subunit IIA [Candidatus Companilactobacillus pullicola]
MDNKILKRNYIYTDISIEKREKKEALNKISELLSEPMGLSKKELEKGLLKREEEGTTGFTDGLAIPHATLKSLDDPKVGVITFTDPIEWESLDGEGVKAAFVLLTPENGENNVHLKMLSQLSRNLMKEEFVKNIQNNLSNGDELFNIVGNIINQ